MMLPLKPESLGQFNTKSPHVWKKSHLDRTVDSSNILEKKLIFFFLFNFERGFYCSKSMSQCSILKLQLHVVEKWENNFCSIVFLFAPAQRLAQICKIIFEMGDIVADLRWKNANIGWTQEVLGVIYIFFGSLCKV